MFRNVLVGVDGSASSARALEQAIDIACSCSGRLGLLGVAPRPSPWVAVTPFTIAICGTYLAGQLEAEARRHVEEAERTVPADVPVTKLMAHGNAAKALLALADTGRWDLVMVGHRPARDRWPFRHGTGDALLHRSPVPVLVVRSAPEASAVLDQPGLERLRVAVGK